MSNPHGSQNTGGEITKHVQNNYVSTEPEPSSSTARQSSNDWIPTAPSESSPDEPTEYNEDDGCCCSWFCVKAICSMFCCPPVPSIIVAKQAFLPPQPPSYTFERASQGDDSPRLTIQGRQVAAPFGLGISLESARLPTKMGNSIASYLLKVQSPRYTILFSHGNAVDIGQMLPFMIHLAQNLHCSVFTYDYSGYGISTGLAREKNQYDDIDAAWDYLTVNKVISPDRIILYGQSIGSSPSTHKARKLCKGVPAVADMGSIPIGYKVPLGGLVLHSPLMSGIRVLRPACTTTLCCDPFQNIKKIQRVHTPTLVIHGLQDDVVHSSHGETLHKLAINPVEPLFIPLANHNDIEAFPQYLARLMLYLDELDAFRQSLLCE